MRHKFGTHLKKRKGISRIGFFRRESHRCLGACGSSDVRLKDFMPNKHKLTESQTHLKERKGDRHGEVVQGQGEGLAFLRGVNHEGVGGSGGSHGDLGPPEAHEGCNCGKCGSVVQIAVVVEHTHIHLQAPCLRSRGYMRCCKSARPEAHESCGCGQCGCIVQIAMVVEYTHIDLQVPCLHSQVCVRCCKSARPEAHEGCN